MKCAFVWLLCTGCLCSATCFAAETNAVPSDFKLSAEYRQGFSEWKPWKVIITADGKVLREIGTSRGGKDGATQKTSVFSTKELQQLVEAVRTSQFFTLKNNYGYGVTDNPTLIVHVTMNGKSHEVEVYAPDYLKDNKEVKRFMKLWNELLRKVPSPNGEKSE